MMSANILYSIQQQKSCQHAEFQDLAEKIFVVTLLAVTHCSCFPFTTSYFFLLTSNFSKIKCYSVTR